MLLQPDNMEVFHQALIVLGTLLAGATLIVMVFRSTGALRPRQVEAAMWRGRWLPWTVGCMSSGLTMMAIGLILKHFA